MTIARLSALYPLLRDPSGRRSTFVALICITTLTVFHLIANGAFG